MRKSARLILFSLLILSLLAGCQGTPRETEAFKTLAPVEGEPGDGWLPEAGGFPAVTPTPGVYVRRISDIPLQSTTYPEPQATSTSSSSAYPEPGATATSQATTYPEPAVTNTPAPTQTATQTGLATSTPTQPTEAPDQTIPAPEISATTTLTVTATEFVGQPLSTPQPSSGSVVSIWHGLVGEQAAALERAIDSFQNAYPDVTFFISYIPKDELRLSYEAASYYGRGPTLLLAPSSWGWWYTQNDLVMDISSYASQEFLDTLNPAAVETLRLDGKLIGLPYSQQGYVLYRNPSILPEAAQDFDTLLANAGQATGMGIVGGYLEREAVASSAILYGIGGQMMDENELPAFNNQFGLDWLGLLDRYDEAGLAGMHTNRDFDLFQDGKIGVMIAHTGRLDELVGALGAENVAIDPWPTVDGGQLSGYVNTEAVFLNTNTSPDNLLASLRFMGYLLNKDVQSLLGETGLIPTVLEAAPRGVHANQAMIALQGGTALPLVEEEVLQIYWNALDEAINNVFERGVSPEEALQSAVDIITVRLDELGGE